MQNGYDEKDFEFVLDTVYRFNSTQSIADFSAEALSCLCTIIPCTQGIFTPVKAIDGRCRASGDAYVYGEEALFMDKFIQGHYDQDPYFGLMGFKHYSFAFRDSDFISDRVRDQSPVFNDIYKPQGIYYALRIELIRRSSVIGQFALFNSKSRGEFSDRDLHIANLLAQHLSLKYSELLECKNPRNEKLDLYRQRLAKYELSQREFQVVVCVVDGLMDTEIAEQLFISLSTVKKHLYNAYSKIGVSSKSQLIAFVLG